MASQDDSSLAPPAPPIVFPVQSPVPYKSYSRHPFLTETGIKGQRVLWLDGNGGWGIYDTRELHTLPGITWEKTMEDWAKKVKAIVQTNIQKSPDERIDSVMWSVDFDSQPTAEMWQILDGLSPKHLHMSSGFGERSAIAPLGFLKHQWTKLETLTVSGDTNSKFFKGAPKVVSRITSLSLEVCYMHNLVLPHATRLKDLHIIENNARDIFCRAVDSKRNSGLAKQLEVLEIRTKNGHDLKSIYSPRGFRRRLKKCTNLREFTFAAGMKNGLDVRLTEYISNSVEELTLEFSRSLPFLRESYEWVESAADSTWLPRLKSFKMTVDPKSYFGDMMIMRVRNSPQERVEVDLPMDFTPKRFNQEFD